MHNTYFTLPVVLLMLSNHYSFTYSHELSWVIMTLFIFAGALIRQYFVLMHAGHIRPGYPIAGVALILVAVWVGAPKSAPAPTAVAPAATQSDTATAGEEAAAPAAAVVTTAQVLEVMEARCVQCHAANPTQPGFAAAPLGVMLDTEEHLLLQAQSVKQVTANKYMPLGNITGMTDEERALVAAWNGQ